MACSPGVTRFFSFVPVLRRKIETRPSAMRRRPSPGDETTQRPSRSAHSSSEWWRTTALRRSKRSSEPLPSVHHPPLRSSRAPFRWLMLERPSAPSSGRSARYESAQNDRLNYFAYHALALAHFLRGRYTDAAGGCAVNPHAVQDYSNLASQGDLRPL